MLAARVLVLQLWPSQKGVLSPLLKKGALFLCSPEKYANHFTDKDLVVLTNVKGNWKYRKGSKPRLKTDDLLFLCHVCQCFGVVVGYQPKEHVLWFAVKGTGTGGQVIRLVMNWTYMSSSGKLPEQIIVSSPTTQQCSTFKQPLAFLKKDNLLRLKVVIPITRMHHKRCISRN